MAIGVVLGRRANPNNHKRCCYPAVTVPPDEPISVPESRVLLGVGAGAVLELGAGLELVEELGLGVVLVLGAVLERGVVLVLGLGVVLEPGVALVVGATLVLGAGLVAGAPLPSGVKHTDRSGLWKTTRPYVLGAS